MKQAQLVTVPLMVLGIVFCVCLVAANFLETKVVQIGSVSVTAGLLVFPISYIINDCIAEVWGFRKARLIIWMGFLMNFMVVVLGKLGLSRNSMGIIISFVRTQRKGPAPRLSG